MIRSLPVFLCLLVPGTAGADDWPTVNHDARRSGYTADSPRPPYRVRWVRQFPGELMTTRVEPIVAGGRVFAGTYAGRLHALDAAAGAERWTARLDGPILHSPAVAGALVYAATAQGSVYAFRAADGRPAWRCRTGSDGFDTAPLVAGGLVLLGSRGGTFFALDARTGALRWKRPVGAPIRTTAASDGRAVYFAAEDMRARAFDLKAGRLLWTSGPMAGQSMRDYYPVLVGSRLVLRSNPVGPFADRLTRDRHILCVNAGVDDSDWRKIEAFLHSPQSIGTPEQIAAEQTAIRAHMQADADSRTLFILDSRTGKETAVAPALYAAGCQGVGMPPALTAEGRPLVFWRSAYTNWTLGVAPMVSVGYLDSATGNIEPIRHRSGPLPPWNTFWGTADETTRFTVGRGTLFISHQGTLSGMDLTERRLFPIAGNRDTWGGYANLPWARNEWHGPARGAVAISGDTLYWITGSRILAVQGGIPPSDILPEPFPPLPPAPRITGEDRPLPEATALEGYVWQAARPAGRYENEEAQWLNREVEEVLSGPWKPLYVQPGLAGREFFFTHSSETFEALALAYPCLNPALQQRVRAYLAQQWTQFPPYSERGQYPLNGGRPRERFAVSDRLRAPEWSPAPSSAPASLYPVWLYASELGEWERVRRAWPEIRQAFEAFRRSGWRLDPARGDLWANRLVSGLIGYARLAKRFNDPSAVDAARLAGEGLRALVVWMRHYDPAKIERPLAGVGELDRLIGGGDGLFLAPRPHKGKPARLLGITPEIAACLRDHAGPPLRALMGTIDRMLPGWYLTGEERQVHFGENFMDYPDQALACFAARLWSGVESAQAMQRYLDIPLCPADLYAIEKRALWLRAKPMTGKRSAR